MAKRDDGRFAESYRDLLDGDPDLLRLVLDLDAAYRYEGRRRRFSADAVLARCISKGNYESAISRPLSASGRFRNSPKAASAGRFARRSLGLAGLGAYAAMVAVMVTGLAAILSSVGPGDGGGRLGSAGGGAAPAAVTTVPTPTSDPSVPRTEARALRDIARLDDRVADFVTALAAYRKHRAGDEALASTYEARVRAFLSPDLDSRTADLEDLGVYAEAGPGDEDGWPEPLSGDGDGKHYRLDVAFDKDAGEEAAMGRPGRVDRAVRFAFERVGEAWLIASVERIDYGQQAPDDRGGIEPVPTVPLGREDIVLVGPGEPTPQATDTPRPTQ